MSRYDTHGVFSSPRALFMLRAFGHHQSSVLNGGLPRWAAEGLSVTDKAPAVQETEYDEPTLNEEVIRCKSSQHHGVQILIMEGSIRADSSQFSRRACG
jgi:3-mercaptopyruvate sulfurtransferase SseA